MAPCLACFFYFCFLSRNHWEILGMGALRTHPSLMLFVPGMLCSPLLQAQGIYFLCLLFPSQVSNTAWCSFVRGAGHLLSRHFGIDFTVAEDKSNELKSRKGKQRENYENVSKRLDYILFSSGSIYLAGICHLLRRKSPFNKILTENKAFT